MADENGKVTEKEFLDRIIRAGHDHHSDMPGKTRQQRRIIAHKVKLRRRELAKLDKGKVK